MKLTKLVLILALSCSVLNVFIYSNFPGAFSEEAWKSIWFSAAHGLVFYLLALLSLLPNLRWFLYIAVLLGLTLIPIDLSTLFQTKNMAVFLVPDWQLNILAILELLLTAVLVLKLIGHFTVHSKPAK